MLRIGTSRYSLGGAPGSILGLYWLQLERTELQEQVLRLGGGTALQQLKRLESRNAVLEALSFPSNRPESSQRHCVRTGYALPCAHELGMARPYPMQCVLCVAMDS